MNPTTQHSGLIAIVGAPNAGKSTLTNALVGQKVSIVTPKVQTTRVCVRGVITEGAQQAVLVDTPGIFDAKKKFEQSLVKNAFSGLKGVDAVVVLVDVAEPLDHPVLEKLLPANASNRALALNKIDCIPKHTLLALVAELNARYSLATVFMISAKTGDGLAELRKWMMNQLPAHPFYFPEDDVSDQPMQVLAAEITREKLFLKTGQELPYGLTVVPESWEQKGSTVHIKQAIVVARENHKKMIIGKGGETIKRIGILARHELEEMLGLKVNLTLFVKVDEKWQEKVMALGSKYEG